MQQNVWYITVVLATTLLIIFLFFVIESSKKYQADRTAFFERLRSMLFWASIAVSVPTITFLTTELPYAFPTRWNTPGRTIDAVGHQWYWSLSDNTAYVGERVHFRVSSNDVTHSFALYNPDKRLVAQTQAMPGYTNDLYYQFQEAGVYKVLCLEYCGLAHQGMVAELNVVHGVKEE